MNALVAPEINKRFFSTTGDPLVGGKLYIYTAGTTDPAISYTSEDADTPNSNPIILDSRGEIAGLFLKPGSYKFVLTDSLDVLNWTQDNITVRDVGAELDSLSSTVIQINSSISTAVESNRIVSGVSSANSSQARFLVPIGTTNQVKVLATVTSLAYVVEGTQYTLGADFVASGLSSPPVTNNTALINDSNLSDQDATKTLGEFGSAIPYDTAGSEITSRDGDLAGFKIAGATTGYFIGRIDNANSQIINATRGGFLDPSGNPINRAKFSDNDTLTLMKLTHLYLTTTGGVLASYTEPVESATEPSSPANGDMWFDTVKLKWMRFNSTAYEGANAVFIGICLQDENGNTVAARPTDFFKELSDENTFEFEYVDSTSIRAVAQENVISVYGSRLKFKGGKSLNIVSHIGSGEIEAANTRYHIYFKENGDGILVPYAPHDRHGDLLGLYHPFEAWRWVASVDNDGSSNFDPGSVRNSLNGYNLFKLKEITDPENPPSGHHFLYVDKADSKPKLKDSLGNKVELKEVRTALLKEVQSQNTNGGTFTSGADRTRVLNTHEGDTDIVTLSSNQFSIIAGKFKVNWSTPAHGVSRHQSFLYNITDSSEVARGSSSLNTNSADGHNHSEGVAIIDNSSTKTYEIRHRCDSTKTTTGFGVATNFGSEIYTQVEISELR